MRTPWRFVADLVSRKPKMDGDDKPSTEREIRTLEYKPSEEDYRSENDATNPVPSADIVHNAEADANSVAPDVIDKTLPDSKEHLGSNVDVGDPNIPETPVYQRDKTSATPVETKSKRRGKSERTHVVGAAVASGRARAPDVEKTFIEQVADLNAEVDVLRHQLASKLRKQNAQLRKMLSRFEAL